MSEQPKSAEIFWYDEKLAIHSKGVNLTPLGFIELVQKVYRVIRPEVSITPEAPVNDSSQLPHISVRLLRRTPSQEGALPRNLDASRNSQLLQGKRLSIQRFNHIFRYYVHARTMAEAESEAHLLEKIMRDYRGWFRRMGVQGMQFDSGGSHTVNVISGVEFPTIYRDYEVLLGEMHQEDIKPIEMISLTIHEPFVWTTETISFENVSPIPEEQELLYPPVWVAYISQGNYNYVEGLDYIVTPFGIKWTSEVPTTYKVGYFYSPQRTLDL